MTWKEGLMHLLLFIAALGTHLEVVCLQGCGAPLAHSLGVPLGAAHAESHFH